jgi:dihydrofolate reductase
VGRLIVTEFMTLDGVAQSPGGPDEDEGGGFVHGGWQMRHPGDGGANHVFDQAKSMDALLLGRKTYEIFAGYWPTASTEIPFTGLLNAVPKYVASRTLTDPLDWSGSKVLGRPLDEAVAELVQIHDEIHVIGSLQLLQSLLSSGAIDRLELWVYPIVLGTGKRVFADGTVPAALSLVDSITHSNGVLQLSYDTA